MRTFFWALAFLVLACTVQAGASLHDTTNAADYLIVAPGSLIEGNAWIEQLAAWRHQHGRTSLVVPTDSIWVEFGNGFPSDSALKDFLFYAYHHWSPPQLKDVFIIGFHDVVPSHVVSYQPPHMYLSDFYFATEPDSHNYIPLFNVGRLPWSPSHSPQVYNYYQKIVAYETAAPDDWQLRAQFIADSSDGTFSFAAYSEQYVSHLHTGYNAVRHYLDYPPDHEWHGDSTRIMAGLNHGSYLLTSVGHPSLNSWGWSLPIDSSNLSTLSNSPRLPVVLGTEMDVRNDSTLRLSAIPKVLLSNPNGGAIAYFAQTDYSYFGQLLYYRQAYFGLATSDSVQTVGDIWRVTATEILRSGFWPDPVLTACMLMGDPGVRLPARPQRAEDPFTPQPSSFSLSCYPNPFNPSTQIQFELARAAQVKLQVMNILGQHVVTLLDAPREAGTYSAVWNAAGEPSGLYFAVLQSASERHVIKMMLLK